MFFNRKSKICECVCCVSEADYRVNNNEINCIINVCVIPIKASV